jgi:hypothetical protein
LKSQRETSHAVEKCGVGGAGHCLVQLLTGEVAVGVVETNPFVLLHEHSVLRVAVSAMLEAFGSDTTVDELMRADSELVAKFVTSAHNAVGERWNHPKSSEETANESSGRTTQGVEPTAQAALDAHAPERRLKVEREEENAEVVEGEEWAEDEEAAAVDEVLQQLMDDCGALPQSATTRRSSSKRADPQQTRGFDGPRWA